VTPADLASALVLGLVGAPHCVAMCGGMVALAQAPVAVPATSRRVHLPVAVARRDAALVGAQSAGRLMTYASGGAIAGSLGSIAAAGPVRSAQSILEVVSGAVLIATALLVAGTLPKSASIERLGVPVWTRLEPLARRLLPLQSPRDALLFGAVWGFLPCGLVYSALAIAAGAGSFAGGATTMLAFGVGTLPALLTMGALAGALRRLARHPAARNAAVVLLATFGLYRVEHGLRPTPTCAHCG
jgi:sulfite exporter TauE/SafE